MSGNSQKSGWVRVATVILPVMSPVVLLMSLVGCATEPYYESAPITPTNVSPKNDVDIGVSSQTTFAWLPTENTQYYEFHIYNQINKDTTEYLRENLNPSAVCQEGLCQLTLNVELPITEGHAWRVRSGNNAGFSDWNRNRFNMIDVNADEGTSAEANTSTQANATVEAEAVEQASIGEEVSIIEEVELIEEQDPTAETDTDTNSQVDASAELDSQPELNVPDLIQPVDGVKVSTGTMIDFKWHSIPNAVSYDFYIYDSVRQTMVESLTDIAAESLCRPDDVCGLARQISLPEASHAWRVRANFENNQSPFSSSRFDVVR